MRGSQQLLSLPFALTLLVPQLSFPCLLLALLLLTLLSLTLLLFPLLFFPLLLFALLPQLTLFFALNLSFAFLLPRQSRPVLLLQLHPVVHRWRDTQRCSRHHRVQVGVRRGHLGIQGSRMRMRGMCAGGPKQLVSMLQVELLRIR